MAERRRRNDELRLARLRRGWTLEDVAERLHRACDGPEVRVDAHMVGRWERGIRSPQPRYVGLLCQVYAMGADELGLVEAPRAGIEGDDEMNRRRLMGALAGVTFMGGFGGLVGAREIGRMLFGTVESGVLDDLELMTRELIGLREKVAPLTVRGPVLAHLQRLTLRLGGSMGDSSRRQLQRLAAQTAILAGRVDSTLALPGDAAASYELARQLAVEAGDTDLQAELKILNAIIVRDAKLGGSGDPRTALKLSHQAWDLAQHSSDPGLRAYVLALHAEHLASLGDAQGFWRDIGLAMALCEQHDPFPLSTRPLRTLIDFQAVEGSGMAQLGLHQAIPALDDVHEEMVVRGNASWQATVLADRGQAYARVGELEAAGQDLAEALQLSQRHDRFHNVARVHGIVRSLPPSLAAERLREQLSA